MAKSTPSQSHEQTCQAVKSQMQAHAKQGMDQHTTKEPMPKGMGMKGKS